MREPAIDLEQYEWAAEIPSIYRRSGGQALIINEIIGALAGCSHVWLPFRADGMLENRLYSLGFKTHCSEDLDQYEALAELPEGIDAVYFGTPTIVNDKVLFPQALCERQRSWPWSASIEGSTVRAIIERAEALRMKRIVSGLGTGDISVHERMSDMGRGSAVVCWKRFRDAASGAAFDDIVLSRDLQ
jgi:hypothetical protein